MGSAYIQEQFERMNGSNRECIIEETKEKIMDMLKKNIRPEFLNRIDDIIMFDQLPKEAIFKIIDLELEGVFERTGKMGYKLQISDEAKNFTAEQGYDIQFGARPLKRSVQKYVEDEVAEQLLNQNAQQGDILLIDYDSDNKKTICKIIKGNSENI